MPVDSITVRVPGSTSNLGSGFDTLGLALKLYNRVRVTRTGGRGMTITSDIAPESREAATAMVVEAARRFFRQSRQKSFGFEIHIAGDVPVARGLGSSTTVQLGCVTALDALCGARLGRQALFEMVTELEGHPDNAAPATFGGFTIAGPVADGVRLLRFPVSPRARFVTLIPRFEVRTHDARQLLPEVYPKADVVHCLNRVALVSAALATGNFEALRGLFDDRIHQTYRAPLIPGLTQVIAAGVQAGAVGGWLSGSGSTLICLTLTHPERIAAAMQAELPDSDVRLLAADRDGCQVEG